MDATASLTARLTSRAALRLRVNAQGGAAYGTLLKAVGGCTTHRRAASSGVPSKSCDDRMTLVSNLVGPPPAGQSGTIVIDGEHASRVDSVPARSSDHQCPASLAKKIGYLPVSLVTNNEDDSARV